MKSKNAYFIILAITTILFSMLLIDYLIPVFWAIIFSILFSPFYNWLNKTTERPSLSSSITIFVILLLVILPSILILGAITNEVFKIVSILESGGFEIRSSSIIPSIENAIKLIGLNIDDIYKQLNQFAYSLSQLTYTTLIRITENIFSFIVSSLIMVYLLFFFLKDGENIINNCISVFPMDDDHERYLLDQFHQVTKVTIKGTFIVAFAQGFLGFVILSILNIQGAILWGFLMALFSILPGIGTAIVWLPITIFLIYSGMWVQGLILLFSGLFIIGLVDNLLRPYLISKETSLPDYLVLLTTIGGISLFGISGFVIGPIIASLFISIWSLMKKINA